MARHPRSSTRRAGTASGWRGTAETSALWAIRLGVGVLLLTPLVVTTETAYPFVVGKAVFSRTVIEVVFALWAVLALANPGYRPPRSRLLTWLGIGFACSVVAAVFGVSIERSLWSNFERMQGVIDAAHWLALAVALAAVFRRRRDLLVLVHVHLGVSALVAVLAVARFHDFGMPFFGALPEREFPRIGGVFGNALYLATYAAVNTVLAMGLGVWAWRTERRRKRLLTTSFLAIAAYLNVHVLVLADARSAWLALTVAATFCGVAYVVWGKSRRWRLGVAATLVAGLVGGGALLAVPQIGDKVLGRLADAASDESVQQRGAALVAGLRGFSERPLTGFGPENFIVPWGRFATGAVGEAHDNAHNRVVEEAATKGVLGLAAHAALWVLMYLVLVRRARSASSTDEKLYLLTLAAALTCFLVNDQLRFPTAVWNLVQVLLLVLLVNLEPAWKTRSFFPRIPSRTRARGRVGAGAGLAAVAFASLGAGSFVNPAIYSAAVDIGRVGVPGRPAAFLERAIERFEPLANTPRLILIEQLAEHWRTIRVRESAEALRLLAVADAQAPLAIAAEPNNWRVHHALARLYDEVARGDPTYRAVAARHLAQSQARAPDVPVRLVPEWRAIDG